MKLINFLMNMFTKRKNPYQQGKEDMELIRKLCIKHNGMFIVSQHMRIL